MLRRFEWDCDDELVIVERRHLQNALRRFVDGELTSVEIELWANVIEGRDDIGFEDGLADRLKDILFKLANPLLNEPITTQAAKGWLRAPRKFVEFPPPTAEGSKAAPHCPRTASIPSVAASAQDPSPSRPRCTNSAARAGCA